MAVGASLLVASGVFRQGLGLITLAITARLLTPEDFGVIAFMLVATEILEMMQRQISLVLVRVKTLTPALFETILTIQLIFAVGTALLLYFSEPLVALLGFPQLVELLPLLAIYALVSAFKSPRFLTFERNLNFTYGAVEETLSRVVYSIAAVTLAWLWRDYWAVAIAAFMALAARGAFTFAAAPMAPRPSLRHWRVGVSFASWSMGAQLAQVFTRNMPQIIIGASLGLADAGIFRLGNRITNLVTTQVFAPLQRVIYPGLADVSRETDRKDQAFVRLNGLLIGLVLPASVGMALIAKDAIIAGFGAKWLAAAQVIWLLAPLRALETLQANIRVASYVDNKTRILFLYNVTVLILVTVLMWVGAKYGFVGALIAAGAASLTSLTATLLLGRHYGTRRFFDPLLVAWRSFPACAVMAATIYAAGLMLDTSQDETTALLRVGVKVAIGIVTYPAAHLAIWAMVGRPDGFESTFIALCGRARARLRRWRSS